MNRHPHRSGGTVNCVAALIPSAAMAGRIPFWM
jgi:hypothetical protein